MDSERNAPSKDATDKAIARRLKRAGKSAQQIASYLRGWNAVKEKK